MSWPFRSILIFIGLPVLGLGALTMYLWQKKEEEEWSEMIRGLDLVERDVRVPQDAVAAVVGRDGSKLKAIQEKTNTKLSFRDGENHLDYATCKITGKGENVSEAVDLVMEVISEQQKFRSFEMWVPTSAVGRIIGKCGDTVRSLSKKSGARINVERRQKHGSPVMTKTLVTIRGTEEQIKMAVCLVEEKVKEEEVARKKLHLTLNRRPMEQSVVQKPGYEKLISGETGQEVYVTAVANPSHFWLQALSPRAADLDHMLEDMTDYYSKEENREPLDIDQVEKGQIVAACLISDSKWYRAEIVDIEPRADPVDETKFDVFFVDYGESEYVTLKNLCYLRTEYLSLRFQAVETIMVGIVPAEGDVWSEAAIDCFEDLTHSGHWKVLIAEVVGYKKPTENNSRAGSPIPCVRLYDPEGSPGVDLGQQLIQKGFAKPATDEDISTQYVLNGKDESDENW